MPDSGLQTRDKWLEVMEKNRLTKLFKAGYEENNDWQEAWNELESDQRREVFTEYYPPDVTRETEEGAPYQNLTTGIVRESGCIADDFTGQIAYTHQMKRDNKYREIEQKTWNLGESCSRKPHEVAVKAMYEGFENQLSADGKPWFYAQHPLSQAGGSVYDDNLITDPLGPTGIENALTKLREAKNEHGKPIPMGKREVLLFVPPKLWSLAQRLAMKDDWLPGSGNFDRNVYKLKPICLDFLAMCPYAWKDTQFYICDKTYTENYYVIREAPLFNTWTDNNTDTTYGQVRHAFTFHIASHRGWIGSKGLG